MFKNTVRNYVSVRDLIDYYANIKNLDTSIIIKLLESTKHFLAATAPDLQIDRERLLTNTRIKAMMDEAAQGLNLFLTLPENAANKTNETKEVFIYCKMVIIERLELLQTKHDKIFDYYAHHDNALKAALIAANQI